MLGACQEAMTSTETSSSSELESMRRRLVCFAGLQTFSWQWATVRILMNGGEEGYLWGRCSQELGGGGTMGDDRLQIK